MVNWRFFSISIVWLGLLLWVHPVQSQGDISAPVLVDLTIEPAHINTADAEQVITVTAIITDDLSGFHDAFVVFKPDAGTTQQAAVYFGHVWDNSVTEGLKSGVYSDTLTLPQFAAEGWWSVYQLSIVDMAGNREDFVSGADRFPAQLSKYRFYNGAEIPPTYAVFVPIVVQP